MLNRLLSAIYQVRYIWRPALVALLAVSLGACIEWKQPTESEQPTIKNYISNVVTAAGDVSARLVVGTPPASGSGPTVTLPIPQLILLGGTINVRAASSTPFNKVNVAVPGLNDYWELTLPAATTSQQVLIVFSQDIPKHQFIIQSSGANGAATGAAQSSAVSVITVGTGDVQVNITWDSKADVDLHVVDPAGGEIYWAERTSATGGQLDLDSNAGCGTDGPRAENIFWASGLIAPHGEYVVRVDYWSACSATVTNYVVTVNARGKLPQVFSGVFTGPGDFGGKGAGRLITTLNY